MGGRSHSWKHRKRRLTLHAAYTAASRLARLGSPAVLGTLSLPFRSRQVAAGTCVAWRCKAAKISARPLRSSLPCSSTRCSSARSNAASPSSRNPPPPPSCEGLAGGRGASFGPRRALVTLDTGLTPPSTCPASIGRVAGSGVNPRAAAVGERCATAADACVWSPLTSEPPGARFPTWMGGGGDRNSLRRVTSEVRVGDARGALVWWRVSHGRDRGSGKDTSAGQHEDNTPFQAATPSSRQRAHFFLEGRRSRSPLSACRASSPPNSQLELASIAAGLEAGWDGSLRCAGERSSSVSEDTPWGSSSVCAPF